MQAKLETRVGLFVLAALGIFVYMGFRIGAFRIDRWHYKQYVMSFTDISGLGRKAEVKIAGVKVGWVEQIQLINNDPVFAEATVMVLKDYSIYQNAHGIVRQDGLLGPKYLEIVPGDPLLPCLEAGSRLGRPGIEPVSVDELMMQFKRIATNVEDVTGSLRSVLGDVESQEQLRSLFNNLSETAEKMASFSGVLERSFIRNEDNIDSILSIGGDIKRIAVRLDTDTLPAIEKGIERISDVFDRDISRVANQLSSTAVSLEDATIQARDGFKSISSVVDKIDEGKGVLGKLVNEDETYYDLRVAVQGLRNYFSKVETLQILIDTHFETMYRPSREYRYEDAKGYVDIRLHPNEDHFYQLELATTERGDIDRWEILPQYFTLNESCVENPIIEIAEQVEATLNKRVTRLNRNTLKVGLQFGRIYSNLAFRIGIFEGFAGLGLDFDIPFPTDKFRWVTSFEGFDWTGFNKLHDRRPHFKWINRMYIMRNIYMAFGADDFISKHDANAFFGIGLRFCDDDLKYLLSSMGSGGFGGTGSTGGCSNACYGRT